MAFAGRNPTYEEQIAAEMEAAQAQPIPNATAAPFEPIPTDASAVAVPTVHQPSPWAPGTSPQSPALISAHAPFDYARDVNQDRNAEMLAREETRDMRDNNPVLYAERNEWVKQQEADALAHLNRSAGTDDSLALEGVTEADLSPADKARLDEGISRYGLKRDDAIQYMEGKLTPAQVAARAGVAEREVTGGAKKPPQFNDGAPSNDNGAKPIAKGGGGAGGGSGGGSMSASVKGTIPGAQPEGTDWDAPYYTQSAAAAAEAEAKGKMASAEGEAAGQQIAASQRARGELDKLNAEYDKYTQSHIARLDEMNKEVAAGQIDPERWWHSKSTGQQILYALAAGLGGAGAVLGHTQNFAMQHIEGAINNDIDAQKENLLNKHKSIENERGLLAEAYHRTHNMEQAVMLAKDAAMGEAEASLKQLQSGAKGEIANAQALMLQGQFDQARKDREEKRAEYYAKLAQQAYLARLRHAGGGKGGTDQKRVQAIGKQIEQHGVLRLLKSIDETESGIAATKGEGLNPVSGRLGWDPRSGARNTLANISELEDVYTKTFGKLSKANAERVHKLMATGDQADVQHALGIMRNDAQGQLQSLRAQDKDAFDQYMSNYRDSGGFEGGGGGGGADDDPNVKPIGGEEE